jgi:hypothetical protein
VDRVRLQLVPAHLRDAAVRGGCDAVRIQHWLGCHSAAFTLSTYVHLLAGEVASR